MFIVGLNSKTDHLHSFSYISPNFSREKPAFYFSYIIAYHLIQIMVAGNISLNSNLSVLLNN